MTARKQHQRRPPLRADAERTVQAILQAAERVLAANPSATMEQIAVAAGVARTTIHRRFATREALLDELTGWAARQFADAVESDRPDTAPPVVALYQVTVNVLRVKTSWSFAMDRAAEEAHPDAARVHADVRATCDRLFRRAQQVGVLRPDVDLNWVRRVYYALIHEAAWEGDDAGDVDTRATRVVDTLLRGVGAAGGLDPA